MHQMHTVTLRLRCRLRQKQGIGPHGLSLAKAGSSEARELALLRISGSDIVAGPCIWQVSRICGRELRLVGLSIPFCGRRRRVLAIGLAAAGHVGGNEAQICGIRHATVVRPRRGCARPGTRFTTQRRRWNSDCILGW